MNLLQKQKWLPAFAMMGLIFFFSSRTSSELPNYGLWDTLIKKGGHVFGYFLLSLADHYWFDGKKLNGVSAAIGYAFLDEFHQSFTYGRHPSLVDVLVFDGAGVLTGALLYDRFVEFIRTRVQILHR